MDAELKPCPWCGEMPRIIQRDTGSDDSWQIVCENHDCPVAPASFWFATADAIAAWNKRAVDNDMEESNAT